MMNIMKSLPDWEQVMMWGDGFQSSGLPGAIDPNLKGTILRGYVNKKTGEREVVIDPLYYNPDAAIIQLAKQWRDAA